jgi:hypothetical protein
VTVVTKASIRKGLREMRKLVDGTHWIKGNYASVEYLEGDGDYEDGAVVYDTKVVGCLVGLARLVAAKKPTYIKGKKANPFKYGEVPLQEELSYQMEFALRQTIQDEFFSGYFPDEDDPDLDPNEVSIEGWNDQSERTKEQVLELLDRTYERVGERGK